MWHSSQAKREREQNFTYTICTFAQTINNFFISYNYMYARLKSKPRQWQWKRKFIEREKNIFKYRRAKRDWHKSYGFSFRQTHIFASKLATNLTKKIIKISKRRRSAHVCYYALFWNMFSTWSDCFSLC